MEGGRLGDPSGSDSVGIWLPRVAKVGWGVSEGLGAFGATLAWHGGLVPGLHDMSEFSRPPQEFPLSKSNEAT